MSKDHNGLPRPDKDLYPESETNFLFDLSELLRPPIFAQLDVTIIVRISSGEDG